MLLGLSLITACAGYSLVVGQRRLSTQTSLVGEHWLWSVRASLVTARGSSTCGSRALEHRLVVVSHGLSCSKACGTFLDQGLRRCPLQVGSLLLSRQGRTLWSLLTSSVVLNSLMTLNPGVSQWASSLLPSSCDGSLKTNWEF